MITDTKDGQTNYCPNCEDQARRIEELERHNRMLVDVLEKAKNGIIWYSENSDDANDCDTEMLCEIDNVLYSSSAQTA